MLDKNVVTRFAPSPTGFMHIGGVRTALFAWLYARQNNGTFILRIEDTDKAREVAGSIEHIQKSLEYIGIDWDYGPETTDAPFGSLLQSERLDVYKQYAQKLIDKGLAYPDPYTQAEVQSFREQAEAEKRPFLFRDHRPTETGEWDGSKPLRFKVEHIKRYEWTDAVRGELSAGEEMLDDFIIIKADGYPTYNFAHIVDDHEMGVTHVMRGEEFISSTPKFLSLYDALEIPHPTFVTMPSIMAADGKKKLGKRDGAKDILEYETDGYLPAAMMNFLALIGWNPGGEQEVFTKDGLLEKFNLDRIQKSGGAFNIEKLTWMNKQHLDTLTDEAFANYITPVIENTDLDADRFTKLIPTIRERTQVRSEVAAALEDGEYNWLNAADTYEAELLKWKQDDNATDSLPRLEKALELLQEADFSSSESIKEALWDYAEEVGKGQVLWPLRVALTGRERSPDPFTCAYVLDPEEAATRIRTAIEKLK